MVTHYTKLDKPRRRVENKIFKYTTAGWVYLPNIESIPMSWLKVELPPAVFKLTSPILGKRCFTTRGNKERLLRAIEDRKAKLDLRSRQRQDTLCHLSKEVDKAKEELNMQKNFFMKLAREENTVQGFSKDGNNRRLIDAVLVVQKAKHETTEALEYVFPAQTGKILCPLETPVPKRDDKQ